MATERPADVRLDDLAAGKLPKRINEAINRMELTVEELQEWEESKSPFRLAASKEHLVVEFRVRIPLASIRRLLRVRGDP